MNNFSYLIPLTEDRASHNKSSSSLGAALPKHHKALDTYATRWKKRDISVCNGLLVFLDSCYEKPTFTITELSSSFEVVVRSIVQVDQKICDGIENCLGESLIDIKIVQLGDEGGLCLKIGVVCHEHIKSHKRSVHTPYMENAEHFREYSVRHLKNALERDLSKSDSGLINRVFLHVYCMSQYPPPLNFRVGYTNDSSESEEYYCLEIIGVDDVITQSFIRHLREQISPRFVSWSFINHISDRYRFIINVTTDSNPISKYNKLTEYSKKRSSQDYEENGRDGKYVRKQ